MTEAEIIAALDEPRTLYSIQQRVAPGRKIPKNSRRADAPAGSEEGAPQYTIQIRDWKTGGEVVAGDFAFRNPTNATKRDLKDLPDTDDLPSIFQRGVSR